MSSPLGNNNHLIVDILTRLNSNQRLILNSSYIQIFHHDLIEDIQAELGGLFEDACVALLKPYTELACDIIYQSLVVSREMAQKISNHSYP